MKKILYVVPDAKSFGGIQQFANQQVDSLGDDYDMTIVDWKSPVRLRTKILIDFLPVSLSRRLYQRLNSGGILFDQKSLPDTDNDVYHFWHIDAAIANLRPNSIICCHGLEILTANVKPYQRTMFIKALQQARFVTTCSSFTRRYIVEHYQIDPEKVSVIPPGINLDAFSMRQPAESGNTHFVIGTLTRFVKRKNVPNIIKALSILKYDYGLDFVYYLAGDGPERQNIMDELKRADIQYQYFGKVSDEDKRTKFYPSLDVFVLPPLETPTDVEGFGIVFLEANASGVPVVASDTGGVSDAVSQQVSGLFANPTSPADIAEKIYEILTIDKDWGQSSRAWAEKFDQKIIAAKFQKLYERVLDES